MWASGGDERLDSIYRRAFGDKYEEEWEVEKYILANGPFIC